MKVKRYKQARKTLNFYKSRFGLHEPYQILGTHGVHADVAEGMCMPRATFFIFATFVRRTVF